MIVTPIHTRVCVKGESLERFLFEHINMLKNGDVLVVTSKIVSLAESRTLRGADSDTRMREVRKLTKHILTDKRPSLTYTQGIYTADAGIDESNGNGDLILPPQDPWKSARAIHKALKKKFKVQECGVLIVDSMPLPGRKGVVSATIGMAGFLPVRSYIGKKDIFKRRFSYSSANCADALAAAAGVVMGEGDEQYPLVKISDAPVAFTKKVMTEGEITVRLADDIYQPLSKAVLRKSK